MTVVHGMYHSEARVCLYCGTPGMAQSIWFAGDKPLVFIFITLLLLIICSHLLFSYLNTLSAHFFFSFFFLGICLKFCVFSHAFSYGRA